MEFRLLSTEEVIVVHGAVLNPGELQGMAGNKSLDGALGRVEMRISYGLINDVYALAAMYAVAISQAHVFNDANKRTAHASMKLCLKMNGIVISVPVQEIGDKIIQAAQGNVDETDLAQWLREQAG